MKKRMALLLILALLTATGLCEGTPFAERPWRIVFTGFDSAGDTAYTMTLYYGEDGLPVSALMQTAWSDEPVPVYLYYAMDGRGNPQRVRVKLETQNIDLTFENTYAGDVLAEATVTDVTVDGESCMEELIGEIGPGLGAGVCHIIELTGSLLRTFPGYRDAQLRIEGCGSFELRFADGRVASSLLPMPAGLMRSDYTWAQDGGYTAVEETEPWDGEASPRSGTYAMDGRNCLLWESFTWEGWPVTIRYRYQDSVDPATGQRLLLRFTDSVDAPEESGILENLWGWEQPFDPMEPVTQIEVDDEGNPGSVFSGMKNSTYDARQRLVRQECYDDVDVYGLSFTADIEYRD